MTTMTRLDAWEVRKVEQERLGLYRLYRSSICGLSCCDDAAKGEELDGLIHQSEAKVAELTDAITDWPEVCA